MLSPTYPILPKNGRAKSCQTSYLHTLTKPPPALTPYNYIMGPLCDQLGYRNPDVHGQVTREVVLNSSQGFFAGLKVEMTIFRSKCYA